MAINVGPAPQGDEFNYNWANWLRKWFAQSGGGSAAGTFNGLDFTASNFTSIVTRNHNNLQTISGGASNDYFHLTEAQHNPLTGISGHVIHTLTDSITAGSTQTQAGATTLTTDINRVTTSGADGDGVKLPTAVAGYRILIINDDAAQTIQIWPNTSDSIDGGAADAVDSNALAAGSSRQYVATDATNWYTI